MVNIKCLTLISSNCKPAEYLLYKFCYCMIFNKKKKCYIFLITSLKDCLLMGSDFLSPRVQWGQAAANAVQSTDIPFQAIFLSVIHCAMLFLFMCLPKKKTFFPSSNYYDIAKHCFNFCFLVSDVCAFQALLPVNFFIVHI